MLCIAIDTAVNPLFPVSQSEFMDHFLFNRGDASGVFALYDVCHHFRKLQMLLSGKLAVPYPVYGYVRIYIPKHIQIDIYVLIDLVKAPEAGTREETYDNLTIEIDPDCTECIKWIKANLDVDLTF